ncbi:MAG: LLM class flavin-dependent oxidoreductase, partial [Mycetocola sp.]
AAASTEQIHLSANVTNLPLRPPAVLARAIATLDLLSGSYLSFESDPSPDRLAEAFPPDTLARLRALKAGLDPSNLFRDNFNLGALAATSGSTR